MSAQEPIRVGSLGEIPEGEMRAYELPWGRVAVVHDEQRLFAFADECPFGGCSLSEGTFDDRSTQVTCAGCESEFDAETGEPLAGPARDPLKIHSAREVGGWVEVSSLPVG